MPHLNSSLLNLDDFFKNHLSHSGLIISHAFLGSCLFTLGIFWFVRTLHPRHRLLNAPLLEGALKLLISVTGIAVEQLTVSKHDRPENYTYTTTYASLAVASAVDILLGLGVVLPEGIGVLSHIVVFGNMAVVCRAYAWGIVKLTATTRLLSTYVALFVVLMLWLDLWRPGVQLIKLSRVAGVTLLGVWMWHSGLVLDSAFSEVWSENDAANVMFISVAFVWDACGVVLLQILVILFTRGRVSTEGDPSIEPGRPGRYVNNPCADDYQLLVAGESNTLASNVTHLFEGPNK